MFCFCASLDKTLFLIENYNELVYLNDGLLSLNIANSGESVCLFILNTFLVTSAMSVNLFPNIYPLYLLCRMWLSYIILHSQPIEDSS